MNRRCGRIQWRCLALALAVGLAQLAFTAELEARQAPADTAAVILDVATSLEAEGRREMAHALLELITDRYPGTPAADAAARRLAALARTDDSGRVELLVWSTIYGAWLGVATPVMFDAHTPAALGIGLLAGAPAAFLTARRYADHYGMGEGKARAITFGGTWGTWQGYGWREVFDLGDEVSEFCPEFDECVESRSKSPEAIFAGLVLGGLAGIGAGIALAETHDVSPGTATAVNLGALWASWFGLAGGIVADQSNDALLATTLVAGNAGLLATAILAPRWQLSRARARLISVTGIAGLVAGFGIDLLIGINDGDTAILIPAATSAIGLALGAAWTREMGPERGPGRDASGALFDLRDGSLAWGTPLPVPMLDRGRNGKAIPGLRVELVRARF